VAGLQISFATGGLMARAGEAHPARIPSKRHPKQDINKGLVGRHLMSTSRGTPSLPAVVIIFLTRCILGTFLPQGIMDYHYYVAFQIAAPGEPAQLHRGGLYPIGSHPLIPNDLVFFFSKMKIL
jgi:hypothetical protein